MSLPAAEGGTPGGWLDFLRSRRSIRRYTPEPLPHEQIERLLAAAVSAPSAHNRQPWRFAVVTRGDVKERLAASLGERLRADRLADGDPPEAVAHDAARSYARITGAPAAIAACLTMADMDLYPDQRRQAAERTMAVQSLAMAVQNLLLAAHAEGLGACWMCAPLFSPEVVCAALDLPAGWEPQALVTLGRPVGPGKERGRKRLNEVVLWR
jgi:F420 biosynthesis protein FbiB-like protein